ncbi:MAG TPA: hypothetical protein PK325_14145 [Cyclobacteriaceae bacterium]|nr:hypothetical protein [Cyclobacteriaceae bacterium]HMV09111.1 hypothetical protein [Cyclobacteriaceae bacterium]HMV90648.1 hypothetical protein [Cyclobacteriaceae bacterium]HMW99484.1 hypothetical protein [Cyclobacteriaceae bacterium]HMX48727.1 hypothetical protein [Cyclobacteriaceae bacterium]
MDNKNVVLIFFLLVAGIGATAQQRQVVVLKKERVLARYQVGDVLAFARAGDKKIQLQKILALNDTSVMMNLDTVAYYRIRKLDIRGKRKATFAERLGAYMMIAGVVLPLADLINTTAVQHEDASIDEGVAATSVAMFSGGALLFFGKGKYFKPGRMRRILIVEKDSPFYKVKPAADPLLYPQQ